MLLHTGAFRIRTRLGRGTFAWVRLDTIYRRVQIQTILDSGYHPISLVCLHANQVFARRCFCTQVLLHSDGPPHRDGLERKMILQRDASTHRCFYTEAFNREMLLHTGALGNKYFYTETILKKNRRRHVFTQVPLHRYAFTHSRFYAVLSRTSSFAQRFF